MIRLDSRCRARGVILHLIAIWMLYRYAVAPLARSIAWRSVCRRKLGCCLNFGRLNPAFCRHRKRFHSRTQRELQRIIWAQSSRAAQRMGSSDASLAGSEA